MIIVLPGADFSANNIGHVDIPLDLDPIVEAYFTALGTNSLTNTQKVGINNFIKGLRTTSILSKVSRIWLPVVGQPFGGLNVLNPAQNTTFPTTNVTYDAKGALFTASWTTGLTIPLIDMHFSVYNTTATTRTNAEGSVSATLLTRNIGRKVATSGTASGYVASTPIRPTVLGKATAAGPIIIRSSQTANITGAYVDDLKATDAVFETVTSPSLGLGANTANTILSGCSIGLVTIGTFLTDTEVAALASLEKTMMNLF